MEVYTVKVHPNGNRFWFQNDLVHRTDGPAAEFTDGTRSWFQNGKLHRTDGPAIEGTDGTRQWWIEGKEFTEQEFIQQTQTPTYENKIVIIDGITYKLIKE